MGHYQHQVNIHIDLTNHYQSNKWIHVDQGGMSPQHLYSKADYRIYFIHNIYLYRSMFKQKVPENRCLKWQW